MIEFGSVEMDKVVSVNRWIGRLQGISVSLAIFVAFAWLVEHSQ